MESIILYKISEIIISISGAAITAILVKKIKDKIYETGCNSGCILTCESFCNKSALLLRNLSR